VGERSIELPDVVVSVAQHGDEHMLLLAGSAAGIDTPYTAEAVRVSRRFTGPNNLG
jgi:hypothetical protein